MAMMVMDTFAPGELSETLFAEDAVNKIRADVCTRKIPDLKFR